MKQVVLFTALVSSICALPELITMPIHTYSSASNDENENINLDSELDGQYFAPVFFSDPLQGEIKSRFIPYAQSSYISVSSVNCTGCGPTYYDYTESDLSKFPDMTPENLVNRTIGALRYEEGYFGTDRVCLPRSDEADLCADDVQLFMVTDFGGYPE